VFVKYLVQISTEETITLTKVVCNCTEVNEAERLYISWGQCRFLLTPFIFVSNYRLFHLRNVSIMNIGAYLLVLSSYFVLKILFLINVYSLKFSLHLNFSTLQR
jgi:hypothetical protein